MEPIEYLQVLLRRWPVVAVGALIGAVFAFVGTDAEPEPVVSDFRATHTLLVNDANPFTVADELVGSITFSQIPVFATTGEVPRRVAEGLGWPGTPAALAGLVTVTADAETGTLTFETVRPDPDEAVRIADAFADTTVEYLAEAQDELRQARQTRLLEQVQSLEAEVRGLDAQVREEAVAVEATESLVDEVDSVLRAQRDTAAREYGIAYESYRSLVGQESQDLNLITLERAQPVQQQSGGFTPPRTRSSRVPIAAGLGAVLGAGVALVAERLDARLRDRRRAEEAFGASVVAELPTLSRKQRAARLIVGPDQHSAAAEAFRSLRTSVTFMAAGGQPLADDDRVGVVLVTSPSPAEGKTTVAVNLAAAFAETGRSVVVVNADFRRPVASHILAPHGRPALPAGLAGIERLGAEAYLVATEQPGIELLDLSPLGGTPGDLTRATVRLVGVLKERFDVVVVDTPPLAVTTEALEFVPDARVVILIGRIGRTTTTGAQRAGELARFGGAEQIAVALSDSGSARIGRTRYYDYYSGGRRLRRRRRAEEHSAPIQPSPDAPVDAGSVEVDEGAEEVVALSDQPAPPDEWREIDHLVNREP